ncbi:MAG: Tat pathway signal sequence domain protein [Nibricoccus sp.]
MSAFTRREFVKNAAIAAAATQLVSSLRAADKFTAAPAASVTGKPLPDGLAELRWLEGKSPAASAGVTWGTPWPRGKHAKDATFTLRSGGETIPVQSWPLAYWPDGSLKWTGHALPADASVSEGAALLAGKSSAPAKPLTAVDSADAIEIDTGIIKARVAKSGRTLIPLVTRDGKEILRNGRLVLLRQDTPASVSQPEAFSGEIGKIVLEQDGPVRAVVKITGRHASAAGDRAWLPFVVRLYFYAGGDAVRMVHTIIYDGDEQKDFIRGLGVNFEVPLRGELHDRHVRFSGEDAGLFGEAVRGITGLRRDPDEVTRGAAASRRQSGASICEAQVAGRPTPPLSQWAPAVASRLNYIAAYADWTLFQSSADGFNIRKRTREGFTWLTSAQGRRAGGLGWVGTPDGGVAFGLRNFWQSHPAQLDIRNATSEVATVTVWMWAPDAASMDLRSYHDGLGQDTYAKQLQGGLEITYEDYEPGFDKPEGVARTSELFLWLLPATPTRERLVELAAAVRTPPQLMVRPEYLHACGVFGGLWSPVDSSSPAKAEMEKRLDWYFSYYVKQREQHRWYGFWNYGDVMHSYDADRHEWRYDVGGFAWDNSELSTDLWLWLYFLRTGRADVFRFAEAMTRHTGEVDVHHIGRFAPLGSRHNVLHWGCSAKQLRISNAANRRYYYYLTGDERVGDLMREQIEAARTLVKISATRKLGATRESAGRARDKVDGPNLAGLGFGTDWGSMAAAWLTEWERTGDEHSHARLLASMRTIAGQPRGFFTESGAMNLDTGAFDIAKSDRVSVSHLSAVFGLVEVCAELVQLIDEPAFKQAWLDYCELYSASPEEQQRRLGTRLNGNSLRQGHSRLTAFAARAKGDAGMGKRAWSEFFGGDDGREQRSARLETKRIEGPDVLNPVDENPRVSTNATAQWGLAAIQNLALVPDSLPQVL